MFEDWAEIELDLRVEATLALDEGLTPRPLLVVFAGDDPLAVVGLRPLGVDDTLPALIEVLALLLPLGGDRLALALPGRVRTDAQDVDRGAPATDGRTVLVLATARHDGGRAPALRARVHPLAHDGTAWRWLDDEVIEIDADGWDVTSSLGMLLGERSRLRAPNHDELHQQLGRCLLLGHTIALAPPVADLLEPARLAGPSNR